MNASSGDPLHHRVEQIVVGAAILHLAEARVGDGQVALQVWLLVDREQQTARLDRVEHRFVDVEGGVQHGPALRLEADDRRGRGAQHFDVEGEHGVDARVDAQCALELCSGIGGLQGELQNRDLTNAESGPVAANLQGCIVEFMLDA